MSTPKEKVDSVLQRVAQGKLSPATSMVEDGWEMKLSSGETVTRSRLQAEARPLIELGPAAVPPLLDWVQGEDLAARYVAVFSLEQITGQKPSVPHFAREDREGHRAKAVEVWRAWYDSHHP